MKNIKQIERKAKQLKKRLDGKPVVENFGQKEYGKLRDFAGNIYDYEHPIRMKILTILGGFFDWIINYTGE